MNLDNYQSFQNLDKQNMLTHINNLPVQLMNAWELGQRLELPTWKPFRRVIVAGLGGSAIGADLLAAFAATHCPIPIFIHRDYDLPAWAIGAETLVIACSHSGNTEETLSAFASAGYNGCQRLAITTGGELARMADMEGIPVWRFEFSGQPRSAVGFSFGLLLALVTRLGLLTDPIHQLEEAVYEMQSQQAVIQPENPATHNPAKRIAGQMVDRWVTVIGSGILAPVARRWKGQISEVAKAWAQFEFLPEADHNTIAGISNPERNLSGQIILFLRNPSDHTRNQQRSDLTRKIFMLEGLNTDYIDPKGKSPLAHQWTSLHLGDYAAYYLAMAYGVDPTPVEAIESLKKELKSVAG